MEMYFCPLYSGSSGNALFCQYGHTRLLIDAGKPGKTISDALSRIGVAMETISGVLITHEHSDHIAGAGVLARKYHMPLYATRGTWEGIGDKIGRVDPELRLEIAAGQDFYLGDIGVEPFSIHHDAALGREAEHRHCNGSGPFFIGCVQADQRCGSGAPGKQS